MLNPDIVSVLYFHMSVTFPVDLSLLPFCLSEMDLGTKRALEVKKAAALQIKSGNSSAFTAKTSQKRKNQGDGDHS